MRLEDTALEIIDRASENSRDVAYRLMIRACPKWSGLCPLELAVDFQVESFLAHRTVQLIVAGEWWRGKYPGSPLVRGVPRTALPPPPGISRCPSRPMTVYVITLRI